MSLLKKIILTHFRNYDFRQFDVAAPIVGITGLNGTGKTNLLDSIYYLCYTKSCFNSREIHNVQTGHTGFRIEGEWIKDQAANNVTCVWKENKKTLLHNGLEYEKLADHIGKYNAVMIAPDDIELINDGSDLRRKYMDSILSQKDRDYLQHLLQYQKILQQRNAYLKLTTGVIDHQLLDIYDAQLAQSGAYIILKRIELSQIIPRLLQDFYQQLSGGKERVNMQYKSCCNADLLLSTLQQARQKDIEWRRTTTGPHIEDWHFTINNHLFKTHGSQGQKKTLLISLKLAQLQLLTDWQKQPILLLDDIFEKLDAERLKQLFQLLKSFHLSQVFITHTHIDDLTIATQLLNDECITISL